MLGGIQRLSFKSRELTRESGENTGGSSNWRMALCRTSCSQRSQPPSSASSRPDGFVVRDHCIVGAPIRICEGGGSFPREFHGLGGVIGARTNQSHDITLGLCLTSAPQSKWRATIPCTSKSFALDSRKLLQCTNFTEYA